MNGIRIIILGVALGVATAACDEGAGKYVKGHDDPARSVTEDDIAEVETLLAGQDAIDREAGLRRPGAAPTAGGPELGGPDFAQPVDETPALVSSAAAGAAGSRTIDLGFIRGRVPEGWIQERPSSEMRLAQIRIPRSPGDPEDGLVTVTHFGAGGGVEANLQRWYGQFEQPGGGPTLEASTKEEFFAGSIKVTIVNIPGTMKASTMPRGTTAAKPNWRMLGGILESSEGPVFFKATGPDKTIAENIVKMRDLLKSFGGGSAGSGGSAAESAPTAGVGERIDMEVATAAAPAGWTVEKPVSSMRKAQLSIPAASGDFEGGELIVFYFGPGQGGSIEDNLNRWYGQFTQPDGTPTRSVATTETFMAGDLSVLLVEIPGTMGPPGMTNAPLTPPKPDWRMFGAIVSTPSGQLFVKATGPSRTMAANRAKVVEFLKSIRAK